MQVKKTKIVQEKKDDERNRQLRQARAEKYRNELSEQIEEQRQRLNRF